MRMMCDRSFGFLAKKDDDDDGDNGCVFRCTRRGHMR